MVTYQPGTIVRYSKPATGEERLTFAVVEDNGDRVILVSRDFPTATIAPREVVAKAEIVAA